MDDAAILVSAVVVHLGKTELLRECLDSLNRSRGIERVETIVVDNASGTPDLEQLVTGYPNTRIIQLQKRSGYPAASNAGIRASRGRYILWCNNDLVFEPNAIEYLVRFLETHPGYGAAGPQLLNPDGSYQPSFSMINMDLKTLLVDRLGLAALLPGWDLNRHWRGRESTPQDVAVGTGACCLIRRNALEEVGGMDERFYMYSEEFDLCLRLWQKGWRVRYVPEARVIHLGGQTTAKTSHVFLLQSWRSRYAYLRKHSGAMSETVLATAVVAGGFARYGLAWLLKIAAVIMGKPEMASIYRDKMSFHAALIRLSITPDRHMADKLQNFARPS